MFSIQTFHFIRPWWFLLLIPLSYLWFRLNQRYHQSNNWEKVCDSHLLPHLLVHRKGSRGVIITALLGLSWLFAILALAGPAWNQLPQPVYAKNSNRVIVFDLSPDMLANDIPPSRLVRARYKLIDLLKESQEGQTALVVYSGEPYVVSPLTNDSKTIMAMVPDLSPSIMPVSGNNLSAGLNMAGKLLAQADATEGKIIVIAGGKADEKTIAEAKKLQAQGYTISVLGVGTATNTPLRGENGQFLQDQNGSIIFSKLDGESLEKLASAGHGRYISFTNDNSDLNAFIDSASDSREIKEAQEKVTTSLWQDEGQWLIFLLLPFCFFAFRRGWFGGQ
ncbi:MAG: VWA domain-containing protein [Gammaproteobacteria bacterium]|nr:VWA domain-containing protein [Gammaproteobacteria bacterium]